MILKIFLEAADKPYGLLDIVDDDDLSAILAPVIIRCTARHNDRKGGSLDQVFDKRTKLPVHGICIDDEDTFDIAFAKGKIRAFCGDITTHICDAQPLLAQEVMHEEVTQFLLVAGREKHDHLRPSAIVGYSIYLPYRLSLDELPEAGLMCLFNTAGQPHEFHLVEYREDQLHQR